MDLMKRLCLQSEEAPDRMTDPAPAALRAKEPGNPGTVLAAAPVPATYR